MKQLLATTLAFTLLGTSAFGAEIKMTCDIPLANCKAWLLKYDEKFLLKDKAYARQSGKWIDLCKSLSIDHSTLLKDLGEVESVEIFFRISTAKI